MGRKNDRVRRANDKGRLNRRRNDLEPKRVMHRELPRIRVEELVMPDGQCRFQSPRKPKARFATEEKAAKALVQAQHQRARVGSPHVEKRYYACPEGGCGGFHLTSRETFDEDLWKRRRNG
jgi:hypothetical protein